MKRTLLILLMIACLALSLPTAAASFSAPRAGMKYKGVTYRIGGTNVKWKSRLGKYTRKLNETSGSLTSYTYTFRKRGVRVTTLYSRKLKKEKITSILIVGKSVTTAGGLKVGQSYARMTKMYGKKFTHTGNAYTYKAGRRTLQIRASGGHITAIKIA